MRRLVRRGAAVLRRRMRRPGPTRSPGVWRRRSEGWRRRDVQMRDLPNAHWLVRRPAVRRRR